MTEKLYYNDQYLKEFTANVLSCEQKGKYYEILLDRTAFFPEGGGQPGDRGFIGNAQVIDTVERDGLIYGICTSPESGEVSCRLDFEFRFSNMQQHSGEHIFSGVLHSMTGFDNVGFHMGKTEMTVDFSGPVSRETLREAEERTNRIIWENHNIDYIYPSAEELPNYEYRSKKEIAGQVRLIGIDGADLCACCGTHVAKTGDVGLVKVITSENYKGGVRITLKAGKQAFEDYIEKNNSVLEISSALKAKYGEVSAAVMKLLEKQNELKTQLHETEMKYLSKLCESADPAFPCVFDDSGSAENARILADMLAGRAETAFAFSGSDESGYKYAAASRTLDVRETGKKINERLGGRGGGKPELVMGSVQAKRGEIEAFLKEET